MWAPWRIAYIKEMKEVKKRGRLTDKPEDCLFCQKLREEDGPGNMILLREPLALVMLNAYPYNPGHLMVAPIRHVARIKDLEPDESLAMWELLGRMEQILSRAMEPGGFNVGLNLGRTAGAGVPAHLHIHIVPRWDGDTNFMPLLGETKVLVEGLTETYERLAGHLRGGEEDGQGRGA